MSDLVDMLRDYQRWMQDGLSGAPSIGTDDIDGDETFGKAAAALTAQAAEISELRDALHKLCCDVAGLEAFEVGVREAIGNTNWNCIQHFLTNARAALGEKP